jgi:HJR/Mrr/RecB family endonuclease
MSDQENNLQKLIELMDSPALKMAREYQKKMGTFQTPAIMGMLETNRKTLDLVSPLVKSILSGQEHLRLSINPQMSHFLALQEQATMKFKSNFTGIEKFTDTIYKLSKWMPNTDTPAAVFTQISSFQKNIHTAGLHLQQFNSYLGHFNRLEHLSSVTGAIPVAPSLLNLELFKQFDYTLISEENNEPESQIILLDEGSRIKRIITDIYQDNKKIYTIQPNDFEDMIAELLRSQQFEVELTKRTRDGGYDLIAVKSLGDFAIRFLVECKRHAADRKIGVGIVRSFRDVINTQGANKGIIVTSSYFSPDAKKERLKGKPYMLDFRDHDDVINWVNRYIN